MSVTVTYNLTADLLPTIQAPTVVNSDVTSTTPVTVVQEMVTAGATSAATAREKYNRNDARTDNVGLFGGGGYAVNYGLALSVSSGLTLAIAAGHLGIAAGIYRDAGTQAVSNGADTYLWASATGDLLLSTSLTVPDGGLLYLGRVTASGGIITAIDQSGVFFRRGGICFRRTADLAEPQDSPPSTIAFLTQTPNDLWLWDGTGYTSVGSNSLYAALLAALNAEIADRERSDRLFRQLLLALARTPLRAHVITTTELQDQLARALIEAP